MKKIELKLDFKNPFKYLYALLVLSNLAALYFVYGFTKKYVIDTLSSDRSIYANQASKNKDDINTKRFESVLNRIEGKSKH